MHRSKRTGCGINKGRERAFDCLTASACMAAVLFAAAGGAVYAACARWPWLSAALPPVGFLILAYAGAVVAAHALKGPGGQVEEK